MIILYKCCVTDLKKYDALNLYNIRRYRMSVITHVHELQKKHEALSSKIEEAQRSPSTDDLYISDLKKQKLRLKEKITQLSS